MLHLFNNVFIEQDQKIFIPPFDVNLAVPDNVQRFCVVSSYATEDLRENPTSLYVEDGLNELLGANNWTTLEDFLRNLMTYDYKIVVYTDNSLFAEIFTCVLKSFTNMETAQLETYLRILEWKNETSSQHYGNLYELMRTAWDISPVYDFSDVDTIPSYEFALASAFADPQFSKKDKLKRELGKFIKREYELHILEIRRLIDTLIFDDDIQLSTLSNDNYTTDITVDNFKTAFPSLQVFKESFFRENVNVPYHKSYEPGSWFGEDSKINLALATPEERQALCDFVDHIVFVDVGDNPTAIEKVNNLYLSRGWTYIESVCTGDGSLTDEEYLAALQEIIDERGALIHVPVDLEETILAQLVLYFKALKKQGNLEELQKYSLK